jgi:hypothetical protein
MPVTISATLFSSVTARGSDVGRLRMRRVLILGVVVAVLLGMASCTILAPNPQPPLPPETDRLATNPPAPPAMEERAATSRPVPSPTPTSSMVPTRSPAALSTPTALPSSTVLVTDAPTQTPTSSAEPTPSPTATPEPTVAIREDTVTIATYQYRQALSTTGGLPYPQLDHGRVGPPLPVTYRLVVLENECLQLSVMPELGGRIYQCVHKPTGQPIFYNNAVVKPTHWGPVEMGWWLAAGGMEWAFPVEEHGYLSAEPWDSATQRRDDGGAAVTVTNLEKTRNLKASVSISLLPEACGFDVSPRIENLGQQPQTYQFWLNAMLAPGGAVPPQTRFLVPAQRAIVHSSGDDSLPGPGGELPWSPEGRLATYANWPTSWLGLFFAPLLSDTVEVHNEAAGIGVQREFDASITPGLKLFAFGAGFDPSTYTDDGSRYVELWGGVTPDFWTHAALGPGEVVAWSERWRVVTLARP